MENTIGQWCGIGAFAALGLVACGNVEDEGLFDRERPEDAGGVPEAGSGAVGAGGGSGGVVLLGDSGSTGGTGGQSDAGSPVPQGGSAGAGGAAGPVTPTPGSCAAVCGAQSPDQSCYCDVACKDYGDCCGDFSTHCPAGPGPGCTKQHCQSETPSTDSSGSSCYCDAACSQYGDCCPNVAQVCAA